MSNPEVGEPYVGPQPFQSADRHVFFGRHRETHEVRALLRSSRAFLMYGQSGTGKTSLLQAGVIPSLEDDEVDFLPAARVRHTRPSVGIRNVHVSAVIASWTGHPAEACDPTLTLTGYLATRPVRRNPFGDPLMRVAVIDQFEELFTAHPAYWQHRAGFFDELRTALEDHPELRIVLSMREEFLAQFDAHACLLDGLLRRRYRLEQMRREAALEAVRRPAEMAGRRWADGVAEQLVDDLLTVKIFDEICDTRSALGEYVETVQLQVACQALWRRVPASEEWITAEHLRRFGDIDTILASFYDDAVRLAAAVCNIAEVRIRDAIESHFITEVNTRGSAYRNKSITAGLPNEVLDELEHRHLLRAEHWAGARWYELTHDRLIEPIRVANRRYQETSLPAGVSSSDAWESANLLAARAERAASAGRSDQAIADANAAMEGFVSSGDDWAAANILTLTADILLAADRQDDAEQTYERAAGMFRELGDDRALSRVLASQGVAAWHLNKPEEAELHFTQALRIDPDLWEARNGRGQVLADAGHPDQALTDLDAAVRLTPDPAGRACARSARAWALEQLGQSEKADLEIATALAATPRNAWALLRRALIRLERGHHRDALSDLRAAQTLDDPPLLDWQRERAAKLEGELQQPPHDWVELGRWGAPGPAGDLPYGESLLLALAETAGAAARGPALETTGRFLHAYGDRVRIVVPWVQDGSSWPPTAKPSLPHGGPALTEVEQLGAAALELRRSAPYVGAKRSRPRQGEEWDMEGGCTAADQVRAASRDEGAVPRGAPTSAYLEGRVAVGLIMVEGPTADLQFSAEERTKVVAEVQNGLSYLATADPAAGVGFVYDIRGVRLDVTPDPNAPDLEGRWRDPAMAALGYSAAWASVDRYVRDIRTRFDTRWAYCAFFTKYPVFHFAYASIGGPRLVMQYANGGWGPDNIDRVFAHQTGHVFGAPDEYTATNCDCGGSWGRFGRPNVNCERCAPGGGVSCLMKGNDWSMCQVTPAHLGWMPSRLIAKHSLKVADVHGASTAKGAQLIQWGYTGGMNQAFRCDPLGGGEYRLVALHSTKVLDVAAASTANGAKVIQWDWHGGANQRWRLESLGDGYVRVVAKHSGRALDVSGVSTGDGAHLVQWDYHGGANQRWLLAAANPAAHSGKVLDVHGHAPGNGAQLIQWDYHGGDNQAFRFERVGGGLHRIVAQHSGRVLDVRGASTANGAKVVQWDWHGGDNQLFRVQPLGDGNVRITAKHSGKSLDVTAASQDNGAAVIQWDWHGGLNQRWLVPQFAVVPAGADEPQAADVPAEVPQARSEEAQPTQADVPAGSS